MVLLLFFVVLLVPDTGLCSGENVSLQCESYTNVVYNLTEFPEDSVFTILSNAPGTLYPNSANCTIQFKTGYLPVLLTLTIVSLNLENDYRCIFDWLCVKGIRFCSIWENFEPFLFAVPRNNVFTVQFLTDSMVELSGFEINVQASTQGPSIKSLEPHGVAYADEPYDLYKEPWIWVDETNYVDGCTQERYHNYDDFIEAMTFNEISTGPAPQWGDHY